MDGYLVVVRYSYGDFPIGLFEHLEDADEFLKSGRCPKRPILEQFGIESRKWEPPRYEVVKFSKGEPESYDILVLERKLGAELTFAHNASERALASLRR